jgi:hypothetical protein
MLLFFFALANPSECGKKGAGEITKNISSLLNALSWLLIIYLWDITLVGTE